MYIYIYIYICQYTRKLMCLDFPLEISFQWIIREAFCALNNSIENDTWSNQTHNQMFVWFYQNPKIMPYISWFAAQYICIR